MRRSELTVLLPPANLADSGEILCRAYPLVISGTVYTPMVYVEDIHISPGNGVLDVRMTGEGVYNRRHTIGLSQTSLPQAAATEMQPLELRLMNLNPDSSVYVVIILSAVEYRNSGAPVSFGGAVRFQGKHSLGTDGVRETDFNDRDDNRAVFADGPLWRAVLTTNSEIEVRNIRDITSQIRVLSPTGTGRIPVTGGSNRVIIIKKDGVTMEVEAESLDFRNVFDIEVLSAGNVRILGLLADAVAGSVLKNGTIVDTKLADNAVVNRTIGPGAVTGDKVAEDAIDPTHFNTASEDYIAANGPGVSMQDDGLSQVGPRKVIDVRSPLFRTIDVNDNLAIGVEGKSIAGSHIRDNTIAAANLIDDYSLETHDHAGVYSPVDHNHDAAYSAIGHNHDAAYSAIGHGHSISFATGADRFTTGTDITSTHVAADIMMDNAVTPRCLIVVMGRGYGSNGFTGVGTLAIQFSYDNVSWTSLSGSTNSFQLDQGVDSTIFSMATTGFPSGVVYLRALWTTTSGYVTITTGQMVLYSFLTSV